MIKTRLEIIAPSKKMFLKNFFYDQVLYVKIGEKEFIITPKDLLKLMDEE